MKLVAGVILITIAIWLTHNSYLVKISKLEKAVIAERKNLEDLKKDLNEKQLEYDKAADLKKLELEMREKRNMETSKEVYYFKIKK
ncbi:MAG: hypothetical protein ACLVH8_02460 [Fusobacterium sp.]|nr:hypothetical protein [Fusobacterium sp.]